MVNFNKVILAGNLTRDIEVRYTQGGIAVGKTGIAINRTYRVNEEKKEETCFVDLTIFGKQAETLSKYVGKGSPLLVEGRLHFSSWEKDGQKRTKLDVTVEQFQFLGSGKSGGGRGNAKSAPAGEEDHGDIPF